MNNKNKGYTVQVRDGSYIVQVIFQNIHETRHFDDETEADLYGRNTVWAIQKGQYVKNDPAVPTLIEALDTYIELEIMPKKPAKSTLKGYAQNRRDLERLFGNLPITKITKNQYKRAMNTYGETHILSGVRKLRGIIRNCISTVQDDGIELADFTSRFTLKAQKQSKPPEKKVERRAEKVSLLLNYLRRHLGDHGAFELIFYIIIRCGAREHEIYGLTWDDLLEGTAEFNYTRAYSIHDKDYSKGKARYAKRKIKFPKSDLKILRKWKIEQKRLYRSYQRVNTRNLIFGHPKWKHDYPSSYNALNKCFREILEKLEIDTDLTVYACRHIYATMTYKDNRDKKKAISIGMGQLQISTFERVYLALSDEEENELNAYLDSL
ncbi:MAG: tyrosine-type recombinase/integrase [Streptococcaceae bacterium]|jgi:integrase|nr:tyrosine-type recombinase/integrase [Streptococcaceae bacterium]